MLNIEVTVPKHHRIHYISISKMNEMHSPGERSAT